MDTSPSNRLIREKSPYLLQHARNPVDWFPWGDEAFEKARQERKPIFLSVRYSTCHWCHVMERESFENPEIAAFLNRHFIPIKVDREERPDVDRVYMTFVQATTGGGGWPMSVWLTPDLHPFLGGTYFPPEDGQGRLGFGSILLRVADAWTRNPGELLSMGENLLSHLRKESVRSSSPGCPDVACALDLAVRQFEVAYDPVAGGFGGAPKFPTPSIPRFLLRYSVLGPERPSAASARDMALHSLRQMARGGIRDALGGGFHRYSVDAGWQVPHFEKMLYDQALIACVYLDAFQLTRDPAFSDVARSTLDYVLRDLTGTEGQFLSGEDADSLDAEGALREGAFYTWTTREISSVLGHSDAELFNFACGVEPRGNAGGDPHGEFVEQNILFEAHALPETAARFRLDEREAHDRLVDARKRLFAARTRRTRPRLDGKALTSWNGLMISALARGARIFGEPRYRTAARRNAEFIRAHLFDPVRASLLRRHCDGESAIDGFADDYAFLVRGLLDLYETLADPSLLDWASSLQARQTDLFWDPNGQGYFSTSGLDPSILLRWKEDHDGAEPSPNAVSAMNLFRLAELTGSSGCRDRAMEILSAFGGRLGRMPHAMPELLCALAFERAIPLRAVLSGSPESPEALALLGKLNERFLPAMTLQFEPAASEPSKPVVLQICRGTVCHTPVSSPEDLARLLCTLSPSTR